MPLRERIEELAARDSGEYTEADRALFGEFKAALNRGEVRAAEKSSETGEWTVNSWVKRGILLGFRMGSLKDMSGEQAGGPRFFAKATYPLRATRVEHTRRCVCCAGRGLYAADVRERRRLRGRRNDDQQPCARGLLRAGGQARASVCGGADRRRA